MRLAVHDETERGSITFSYDFTWTADQCGSPLACKAYATTYSSFAPDLVLVTVSLSCTFSGEKLPDTEVAAPDVDPDAVTVLYSCCPCSSTFPCVPNNKHAARATRAGITSWPWPIINAGIPELLALELDLTRATARLAQLAPPGYFPIPRVARANVSATVSGPRLRRRTP